METTSYDSTKDSSLTPRQREARLRDAAARKQHASSIERLNRDIDRKLDEPFTYKLAREAINKKVALDMAYAEKPYHDHIRSDAFNEEVLNTSTDLHIYEEERYDNIVHGASIGVVNPSPEVIEEAVYDQVKSDLTDLYMGRAAMDSITVYSQWSKNGSSIHAASAGLPTLGKR